MITGRELKLGIMQYDFPENLISKLKNKIESSNRFNWINSGVGTSVTDTSIRSSKNFVIDCNDVTFEKIKKYIYECCYDYEKIYKTQITKKIDLQVLKYEVGENYKYHTDSSYALYRTVSCLIYINPSEYEGGETDFEYLGISIKPESPKLVLFPSNFIYSHAALPVTDGVKYVIVGWMNDIPEEV